MKAPDKAILRTFSCHKSAVAYNILAEGQEVYPVSMGKWLILAPIRDIWYVFCSYIRRAEGPQPKRER